MFSAPRFHTAAITAITILTLTAVYLDTWTAKPVELRIEPDAFPLSLAGFSGKRIGKLEKPFYSGLADDEIIATYTNPAGRSATVYIGHFRSQNQESELVDYRYNWLQDGARPVELEVGSQAARLKRKVIETRQGTEAVYFYYDINGRDIIDPKWAKLASLTDAIMKQRNNGTVVIVMFDDTDKDLSPDQRRFLGAVVNEVRKIVPE